MTDEIDLDAIRAELAFVEARIGDLESAHRERLKALGGALPPEVFARGLADAYRRSGNDVLADKWTAAWAALMEALQKLDELNTRHAHELERPDPAPVTAAEREEWAAVRDAANEAEEQFERVLAEGITWLDSLGPKA